MRKFGLIGKSLKHSFSEAYFGEKFFKEGIGNCSYSNFEMEDTQSVREWVKQNDIRGFNVTIPFKEAILSMVDECTEEVKAIGASNCIKVIRKGEDIYLTAFNTDVVGIHTCLKSYLPESNKGLILGSGGASKAVQFYLKQHNIPYQTVSRDKQRGDLVYESLNRDLLNDIKLIVNCTPLGTYPNIDEYPRIPFEALTKRHLVFDLIYNPEQTKLLQYSRARGARIHNGMKMLISQAEASWAIWTTD